MPYNFAEIIPRENTTCYKWDLREKIFGRDDVIPMWVADMDIAVPDFIMQRISQRLKHPVFGYTYRDKEYNDSIALWSKLRYGWSIDPEWISFCPGVVAGIINAIQTFTKPDDRIIIQPPVYHPFFHVVEQNKRKLVTNPLIETNGHYQMDYNLLESQLKEGAKMVLLCHPHNPVGRVWTKDELKQFAELCIRYNALIVSDEIHADLIYKPHAHIPLASISDEIADGTLTFSSASKTFNLAGLGCAHAVITNRNLRKRYDTHLIRNGVDHTNPLSAESVKAAYTEQGQEWLGELLEYFAGTIGMVKSYLTENLKNVKLIDTQGTYLLWFDFRATGLKHEEVNSLMINNAKLGFNTGTIFGPQGNGFQRMNIACPRSTVEEAMERMGRVFG